MKLMLLMAFLGAVALGCYPYCDNYVCGYQYHKFLGFNCIGSACSEDPNTANLVAVYEDVVCGGYFNCDCQECC